MTIALSRRGVLGAGLSLVAGEAVGAVGARPKPVVIGHRGACALRPEHSLASYAKAIADGADFVEPDLVSTKDGVLVARHENNIAETTDVAERSMFAARRTTKTIDGEAVTGWFTEDFTFAELKTLRAKERLGAMRPESASYDGAFQIVSFEEIADFVAAESAARGRVIGLIPEIKHSTYFASIGLPLETRFLDRMAASRYLSSAPIIVQSFEVGNLKALRPKIGGNVRLMQLVGGPKDRPADFVASGEKRVWGDLLDGQGLRDIASYAHWLAPNTRMLMATKPDGTLAEPSGLIGAAHRAGLLVGTWTFRPENHFLPTDLRDGAGDGARNPRGSLAEIRRYIAAGIDGFFTDDPALGREAVDKI
jgi:glycerophosphoryl diester phosphodiesterase